MMKGRPPARWFVVAAIALVVICGAALVWNHVAYGCHNDNPPLASFYLRADQSQRQHVIRILQQFAKDNSFRFDIVYYTPDYVQVGVELSRKDTTIEASNVWGYVANVPYPAEEYTVGLYNNNCIHPTWVGDITGLVDALRLSLGTIPGAKICAAP